MEAQAKEYHKLDDIKKVKIDPESITLLYDRLKHQYELDVIEEDKKINFCMKFINTQDKLYHNGTKNLLEYLNTPNIKDWLFSHGFNEDFYANIYITISFWVDMITTEYTGNVKSVLMLREDQKNTTDMNYPLNKLRSCYETLKMYYFEENKDVKSFDKLSYREQHLIQSYATKMNYIDVAINKNAKKQIEDKRSETKNTPKRGRFSSSSGSF
jgi:ribonucleotide reductase beta subunit family protein with ferritin-like domain